jgi:hypothetical protein
VIRPELVKKEMLTDASDAAGLNRESVRAYPGTVDPPAKAHREEGCVAQGAVLQPLGPPTTWLTATPPAVKVKEDELLPGGSPLAGFTATVPSGGATTERRTLGTVPLLVASPMEVIAPDTDRDVELVR